MELFLEVFAAAFLGNLLAWWWVFKKWKFPKIVYIPVNRDNRHLVRLQRELARAGGNGSLSTNEEKDRLDKLREKGLGL